MHGEDGNDWMRGNDGDDTIAGEDGHDRLYGGSGNDMIAGGEGCDVLSGDWGNDTLNGGADNDCLTGGSGADVFVYDDRAFGNDTITDFSSYQGDRIDMSNLNLSFEDLNISRSGWWGRDTVIEVEGGGSITLKDFRADNLDEDDFIGLV